MENKKLITVPEPVIQVVDGHIKSNLDELGKAVHAVSEFYSGLVVDDIPKAKKTVADLRKLSKAINDQKIAAKKEFMKEFEGIESKVKEFCNHLETPIKAIVVQIEKSEQLVFEKRKGEIEDLMEDEAKILDDTQARFFNDSVFAKFDDRWTQEKFWTPKGKPTKKLTEDIALRVKTCLDGINTILSVGGEFVDQLLAEFKTSGVIAEVLASLEAKKEAKRQAEAFVPQETVEPEVDSVPAFMQATPVEVQPSIRQELTPSDLPDFMKGTITPIQQQEVKPAGKQLYTIQMHCTEAQYRRARSAIAMVGVEILN